MLVHVVPYGELKAQMPRGTKRSYSFEAENIHEVISALDRLPGVAAVLRLYPYEWKIGRTYAKARKFNKAEELVANKLSGELNADGSLTIYLKPDVEAKDPATIMTQIIIAVIVTAANALISYLNPRDVDKNDTSKATLYDNSGNTHQEGDMLPLCLGDEVYIEPPVIELSTSTMAGIGQSGVGWVPTGGSVGGMIFDYLKYRATQGDAAGGSKSPRRLDNNASSNAIQRVMFATAAGRIGGIKGTNQAQKQSNIWVNEQQLQDPVTGQLSIPDGSMSWDENFGEEGQPALGLSPGIANSLGRNRRLKNKTSTNSDDRHEERVTDDLVDRVVVRVRASAMVKRDKKGNESNHRVDIRFRVKRITDTVWINRGSLPIAGKSSTPFDREYNVAAPPKKENGETWEFEMWRTTPDSNDDLILDETTFVGFDEFQDREFRYDGTEAPGQHPTATFATVFRLSNLDQSRAPKMGLVVVGLEAWVPTNYDPVTATYATSGPGTINGEWDGTWVKKPTRNPAFHWHNILRAPRIGKNLPASYFDRYAIYEAGKHCDEIVNGRRRYTLQLAQKEHIKTWDLAAEIARSMRAMQFWSGDRVSIVQDREVGFIKHFVTNTQVKGGQFQVKKTPLEKRYNVIEVVWQNPKDMWRDAVTVYRDEEKIEMMRLRGMGDNGELVQRVRKWGCTNEQEAYDYARAVCYDACRLTDHRQFDVNVIGVGLMPGEVFELDDSNATGKPPVERIKRIIDANTIELDHPVTLEAFTSYKLRGVFQGLRAVRDIALSAIDYTGTILTVPNHGLTRFTPVSIVEVGGIQPRTYRIADLSESDAIGHYGVQATQYDPTKYAYLDGSTPVPPVTYYERPRGVSMPTDCKAEETFFYRDQGGSRRDVRVSWIDGDDPTSRPVGQQFREDRAAFEVQHRIDGSDWYKLTETESYGYTIQSADVGVHDFRVRALSIRSQSGWAYASVTVGEKGSTKPPAPTVEAYF